MFVCSSRTLGHQPLAEREAAELDTVAVQRRLQALLPLRATVMHHHSCRTFLGDTGSSGVQELKGLPDGPQGGNRYLVPYTRLRYAHWSLMTHA
jgi:hypothetical protein